MTAINFKQRKKLVSCLKNLFFFKFAINLKLKA